MKKILFFFMALVLLSGLFIAQSEATLLCYKMDTYSDIFKVSLTVVDGQKSVVGQWYAPSTYNIPIVGGMVKDASSNKIYALQGSINGLISNQSVLINIVIDPITKNGTWNWYMLPNGTTNSGTLSKISCSTAAAPFSTEPNSVEAVTSGN